jgi:hypothetical protein
MHTHAHTCTHMHTHAHTTCTQHTASTHTHKHTQTNVRFSTHLVHGIAICTFTTTGRPHNKLGVLHIFQAPDLFSGSVAQTLFTHQEEIESGFLFFDNHTATFFLLLLTHVSSGTKVWLLCKFWSSLQSRLFARLPTDSQFVPVLCARASYFRFLFKNL